MAETGSVGRDLLRQRGDGRAVEPVGRGMATYGSERSPWRRLARRWRGRAPVLRISVTAGELARAYAALAADQGDAAIQIRQWREVPNEQTFGVREVARRLLGVEDRDVAVKCGWFGGERVHAIVLVKVRDRTIGAAVTTSRSPDPATAVAVRDASGDDRKLDAAHERVAGEDIREAIRRELLDASEL